MKASILLLFLLSLSSFVFAQTETQVVEVLENKLNTLYLVRQTCMYKTFLTDKPILKIFFNG